MSGKIFGEKANSFENLNKSLNMNDNSPLKLFTHAKNTVIDIFKQISNYVDESISFLEGVKQGETCLIKDEKYQEIKDLKEKVTGISKIISRDHMKVVFFGRTSNGKSTTINAMLRDRILPSGMGHTTNCFLQIEGTDDAEPSVLIPDSNERKCVTSLGNIGSALSNEKLDSNSLVKILWPKAKCRLIKDDVVIVDSPGVDVSTNLDQWIQDYCLDADVFVLVVSAVATLTISEKKFLIDVARRLSNPNIFILMNQWDATSEDDSYTPEMICSVRKQHLERGVEFLCDELKSCDRQEAEEHRIFFLSAREALASRNKGTPASPRIQTNEGYHERLAEFNKFEFEFEKCISKTAVQTKFATHTTRGKEFVNVLNIVTKSIIEASQDHRKQNAKKLDDLEERHDFIEKELRSMTESTKERIRHISEDVYNRVAQVLNDEIKRLYTLIEDFDHPFSPDREFIPVYKRELNRWLEARLGSNLQNRLHSALQTSLDEVYREIKGRVKAVLENEERLKNVEEIVPRSDFTVSYRLDCLNLCADFHEDIEFKFSLGFNSLWTRFVQNQKTISGSYLSDESVSASTILNSTNEILATANSVSNLTSKSGLLLLGAGALLWRSVGWKVIGVVASIYGSFYLYERLMWTKKAQQRLFKRQYANYASSKIKLIVDLTSGNASSQVKQELSMYFAQTLRFIDQEKDDLADTMKKVRNEINHLAKTIDNGKRLTQHGIKIHKSLDDFATKYLSSKFSENT